MRAPPTRLYVNTLLPVLHSLESVSSTSMQWGLPVRNCSCRLYTFTTSISGQNSSSVDVNGRQSIGQP